MAKVRKNGQMDVNRREQHIKALIKLEDRITRCRRCPSLLQCTSKPSMGKGDLVPETVVVFEWGDERTQDIDWIIDVRNSVQKYFNVDTVYHTFLVRCQPKACPIGEGIPCRVNDPLPDIHNHCRLTNQPCIGIPIKPSDATVLNCLNFLIEELQIFQPQYVIMFGQRVSEFILKSFGILESILDRLIYHYEGTVFLSIRDDQSFRPDHLKELASLLDPPYDIRIPVD